MLVGQKDSFNRRDCLNLRADHATQDASIENLLYCFEVKILAKYSNGYIMCSQIEYSQN